MPEINYTWSIDKLECAPLEGTLTNVVKVIHWTYQGQEQIESGKTSQMSNQYPLPSPSSENYINYSDLTENDVIEWLETTLDVNYLKSCIQNDIQKLYERNIILPLPWIKEPEPEIIIETTEENIVQSSEQGFVIDNI